MSAPGPASGAWERRASLCGVAFVVMFVAGVVLGTAGSVDLAGTRSEVAASYDENQALLFASERILVLAAFFFFAFVGGLGGALRRAEGPGGWLAGLAVAAGAASALLLLAAAGLGGVEAHEGVCAHDPTASDCSGAEGSLDPSALSVLASLAFEFLVLAAIPLGVFLAATAIVVRSAPSLPRRLGTAAGILAVLFPIATIVKSAALVLYLPFLAWVVAASILVARPTAAVSKFPARS